MKRQNKTFKASIAIVLILAMLAAIGIGAYLTDTDVKKDVYTVGNVQAEIVANGDMEMDNVGALLPGTVHTYERAATNTGINDAYVFMSLTIPYEMVGAANEDGSHIGERIRQLFIPGSIGSEWKLVDVGHIGQYEIKANGQLNGEHDEYSVVVGDTITYVYGYIGDNADGALKALASGETTSNLIDELKLANIYNAGKINGEVSTKLYAIQSNNVNGGLTDVNGVWAVINKAISGEANVSASTVTYNVANIRTAEGVGYAPLKLVDGNGNVVATSVANEYGNGQFQNVPAGEYTVETSIGTLTINGQPATVVLNGEDISIAFDLTTAPNTLVQGAIFNYYIPDNAISVEFVAMPQTYGLADRTLPADAVDVSEAADGSVMAWMEDTTFYVVAMNGEMIYANPNGSMMFAQKTSLTHIGVDNLSTENMTVADYLFFGCEGFTEIAAFDFSNAKNLIQAFTNCYNLTSVVIPNGIEGIHYEMFFSCSNLTSITIPASVTDIGDEAFFQCWNLETVTFAEGSQLEYIGWNAFGSCERLTNITIPANVNDINGNPFYNCHNLTAINVDPANEYFVSIDGVLYTKDMKTLICYPTNKAGSEYVIPASVTSICPYAFQSRPNLTTVTFEEGSQLKEIGNYAFRGCTNLKTINLPEGVTSIGQNAFQSCTSLASINIPVSVIEIGKDAFGNTKWLNDKIANEGVVYVNGILVDISAVSGNFAFPEGTTEISDDMFSGNTNLTSVYIPASVTSIGSRAFADCSNLTTVTFAEGSQLKGIGYQAFWYCEGLTSVNIPASITNIDQEAFFYCSSLTEINLPNGLETIGNYAFYGCANLTEINIPASVINFSGVNVFTGCSSLTAINVDPANTRLVSIDGVLYSKSLKTLIHYPAAKTDKTFVAPTELEMLFYDAFDSNPYIEKITLPARIDTICNGAFNYCSNLKTINFCGTQAQWNQIYFTGSWCDGVHPEFKIVYDYVIE